MVPLKSIRQDLWLRVIPRKKARTSLYLLTSGPIDHNRVLLALTVSHGLLIHQMNVKTTFLNIELDEEIYMD
jgi:hypothetical protein